jgi:two-component system, OmpR family, response regulator VicR
MKVLLIEPNVVNAKQYISACEHEHTHIAHVTDAQSAIVLVDEQKFDVIVLELLLKKHNGLEFLYELRSYADSQHIPVLLHTMVSPSQFTTDETLLTELGVVDYLYKPETSLTQLASALRRIGANT